MTNVELVIKIPEGVMEYIKNNGCLAVSYLDEVAKAIKNGTPLPKGHGKLKDVDKFLERVKKDREHEIYLHSWTADMVLERLDSWYAPTIIEADKGE